MAARRPLLRPRAAPRRPSPPRRVPDERRTDRLERRVDLARTRGATPSRSDRCRGRMRSRRSAAMARPTCSAQRLASRWREPRSIRWSGVPARSGSATSCARTSSAASARASWSLLHALAEAADILDAYREPDAPRCRRPRAGVAAWATEAHGASCSTATTSARTGWSATRRSCADEPEPGSHRGRPGHSHRACSTSRERRIGLSSSSAATTRASAAQRTSSTSDRKTRCGA